MHIFIVHIKLSVLLMISHIDPYYGKIIVVLPLHMTIYLFMVNDGKETLYYIHLTYALVKYSPEFS